MLQKMKLGDIYDVSATVTLSKRLFGATAEFNEKYSELMRDIGNAIFKEKGIGPAEATALDPSTELTSEEVKKSFSELKQWLAKQHKSLKDMAS